jgi:uroporphyrin-III C-methyltransferase
LSLLPIFLKLEGRPGLLVGAGNVALEKIGSLLKTGLRLRVVAPQVRPEIRQLAQEGKLSVTEREFALSDLDGNFIVITATDSPAVNQAVYAGALERNILCNSVDDIPNCDFFFGSVVSRGDLQIAISTAGESPAFAQRLRREIDEQLAQDLDPWLANLGELRREILATHPRTEERKLLLHELAHREICDSATCPSRQLANASNKPVILGDRSAAEGAEGPAFNLRHRAEGSAFKLPEGAQENSPGQAQRSPGNSPVLIDLRPVGAERTVDAHVALVGAGPGDPELLTVRALRLIQSAQVILHDDLVPDAILSLASPSAMVVNVGKRCGAKNITQDEINALMIQHAQAGRTVVRLKSGDPLLFGRAAEEISALEQAGISYAIVPGVSAAFAAAAALGRSLTDRACASSVLLTTGQHAQSHNNAPLPQIEDATRVVYMPGRDLTLLAAQWLAEGLPPDFPCAVVSHAALPGQQVLHSTLGELSEAKPTTAPSLLIAGWAVKERALRELVDLSVSMAAAN